MQSARPCICMGCLSSLSMTSVQTPEWWPLWIPNLNLQDTDTFHKKLSPNNDRCLLRYCGNPLWYGIFLLCRKTIIDVIESDRCKKTKNRSYTKYYWMFQKLQSVKRFLFYFPVICKFYLWFITISLLHRPEEEDSELLNEAHFTTKCRPVGTSVAKTTQAQTIGLRAPAPAPTFHPLSTPSAGT